jgi:hypothetical protein
MNNAATVVATSIRTPNGELAVRVTCACPRHADDQRSALVRWPSPRMVDEFPRHLVCGNVRLAHSRLNEMRILRQPTAASCWPVWA